MKFCDVDFRILDDTMVVFPAADVKEKINLASVKAEDDLLLAYCYIDHLEGLLLAVLASGHKEEDRFTFNDPDGDRKVSLKLSGLAESEFEFYEEDDDRFYDAISSAGQMDSEDLLMTRGMEFLDSMRKPFDPDAIRVLLTKENVPEEECLVRIEKAQEHRLIGTLCEDPKQSFGYRVGETLAFYVSKKEDGQPYCIADLNYRSVLTKAELEDGSLLKGTIHSFNLDQNENGFAEVLQILRDSELWIPVKNDTLLSVSEKEPVPGLLQRNDKYYLPVFTDTAEMKDATKKQPRTRMSMLKAIELAKKNEVAGIVVNPFNEPFIVHKKLFTTVASMKSLLEELN